MIYLDTSALVSFVAPDAHTPQLRERLRSTATVVVASVFGMAEFSAVLTIRVRAGTMTTDAAAAGFRFFDSWLASRGELCDVEPTDHHVATAFVRRFDLGLRAPDALHLAVCRRLGLPLLTFDARQAAAARVLGIACDPAAA